MEKNCLKACVLMAVSLLIVSCGSKKFDTSKSISVTTREDGSGTKGAFMEILGLKGKADVKDVVVATGTAAVMEEVKNNNYSIAFDSLGYVTDDVKKMKVDGVEPTTTNIKNGSYSISRPLNVIYKEDTVKNSVLLTTYLEFLNGKDAQEIISKNGYVVPIDSTTSYTANPALSGKINISGSTSLQPLMILLSAKYEEIQSKVTVEVSGGGSGTGYSNGENGVSDFGMISEVFNSTKAPSCVFYTVAKDGIAIIVNKENIYNNITKVQLKNIYNSEEADATKIKFWSDLEK